MGILDRRLIVVLGKGGVGRTTVTAALGLAAARSGRRALAVEVASQSRLARMFGAARAAEDGEALLVPGLSSLSIDPQRALFEYLVLTLKVRAVAERLADSRAMSYITAAAPGLREIVTLGKIWHLTEERLRDGSPRYDVILLDAPATGHGIGLLRTPGQYAEISRVGRVSDEARAIEGLIRDRRRTAIALVTLAEEMPVSETIDAVGRLRESGFDADCAIANALYPDAFTPADENAIRAVATREVGETGSAAVRAAMTQIARRREQTEELDRLRASVDLPLLELPFLFVPMLDVDAVGELADRLGPGLEKVA